MKSLIIVAIGFGLAGCSIASPREQQAVKDSQVTVTYSSPEKFTDFTSSGFGAASDKDLKYLTEYFTSNVEKFAQQCLAPDERLEITFKDIDLAGRFEPENGPRTQDVRIYRDVTFPRMILSFRLLGPDGQVRAEGERKLMDMNYSMNLMPPTADTEFRYDKALLRDWMYKEFKRKQN